MSSPKLRLIFRPKSEIQTFFSPKIRWSPKKKKKQKVFTKIETDFSAGIGNSNVFFAQNQVVSKKKKKKKVFTKIETDFSAGIGNSNVFFAQNQVVSKKKKKKEKKKILTKIETDFSAGFVTFRSVGGMHPEMEPNYSK